MIAFQNCQKKVDFFDSGLSKTADPMGTVFDGMHKTYVVDADEPAMSPNADPASSVCATMNGKCSLYASLQAAGNSLNPVVIRIQNGIYNVTSNLTIPSRVILLQGESQTGVIIDGSGGTEGIFTSFNSGITFSQMTFRNGIIQKAMRAGSALTMNGGTVSSCLFDNNSSTVASHGAVFNPEGKLKVLNSKFTNNKVTSIYADPFSEVEVRNSSFEKASDDGNGGTILLNGVNRFFMENSTIEGNIGSALVFLDTDAVEIKNSTIANNMDPGIRYINTSSFPSTFMMTNTTMASNTFVNIHMTIGYAALRTFIMSNNILTNGTAQNCTVLTGMNVSGNNNIISDASCSIAGSNNQVTNPQLSPLANNGGPTRTMLPLPGSPAIDAGDNLYCPVTDQRGFNRPIDKLGAGSICDIGAVEVQ